MRLKLDTSTSRFIVTKPAEPRLNFDTGSPKIDPASGAQLYSIQLLALDDTGGEVLTVTVIGDPKLAVTQPVSVAGLVAIPWSQGDRNGVAFRAAAITAADSAAGAAKSPGQQGR